MGRIELDDETHALIRFAARLLGVSESEVIARAIAGMSDDAADAAPPTSPRDAWEPVPIYAEYDGRRIEAEYVPATRRLIVKSEPLAGQTFKTPSAAARAVVAALNPARVATHTNGWRFFRVAETHARLDSLR